jgi:hypothetical protein
VASQREQFEPAVLSELLARLMSGMAAADPIADDPIVWSAALFGQNRLPTAEFVEELLRSQFYAFYRIFHAYYLTAEAAGGLENPNTARFLLNGMGWIGVQRRRPRISQQTLTRIWTRGGPALAARVAAMPETPSNERYPRAALEAGLDRFHRFMEQREVEVPPDFDAFVHRHGDRGLKWWIKACANFRYNFLRDPRLQRDWRRYLGEHVGPAKRPTDMSPPPSWTMRRSIVDPDPTGPDLETT